MQATWLQSRLVSSARRTGLPVMAMLAALVPAVAAQSPTESAQIPPEALPGVFTDVLEVRVVNLEVVVTDRDGNRVPGLGPEAFRLLVDGVETPIGYFTEVRGGVAEGRSAEAPEIASVPAAEFGRPVPTRYLVFVDDFFSIGQDRDTVLEALAEDLSFLGPEDQLAIVAWDGRQLEMLSSWQGSSKAIERALDEARERPAYGLQRLAERRRYGSRDVDQLLEDIGLPGALSATADFDSLRTSLDVEELFYVNLLAGQVERSVTAAAATLRGFANPPGRKVMLLLSGGWPFLPADYVVADFTRPLLDRSTQGGGSLFRVLTDTANQLGYTLYPVDVPGLRPSAASVEQTTPARAVSAGASDFLREQETHASLGFLAEETGGEALLNSRRVKALEVASGDTRSYYWLGFSPQWQEDDSRHDVRIEVVDPSLRVRSRAGYLDSSRKRQTTMRVESSLLFGNPPSVESLRISFGKPTPAGLGKMEVPLTIAVPLDEITFLPQTNGHYAAELELRVAVIDERGERAEIPIVGVTLDYEGPPPSGRFHKYETSLKMRRQEHRAVVSLFDPVGGRMLSATAVIAP